MNVLVGCEYSGTVRDAFREHGHYAMSCDILPTENSDGDHWQGDIWSCLHRTREWDLIILHPPCTHLAVSGNAWYGSNKEGYPKRLAAQVWTKALWELAQQRAEHVVLENPVGVLSNVLEEKPQYIQPWQFGHPEFKKTGLWRTDKVPELQPTDIIEPPKAGDDPEVIKAWNRIWNMPKGPNRGKERSRFYKGFADAMASQWGVLGRNPP